MFRKAFVGLFWSCSLLLWLALLKIQLIWLFFQLILVYVCVFFFNPNPDLHNLKISSIFPRMGLYRFQFCIFWINIFIKFRYSFLAWVSVFLSLNTRNG